MQKNISLYYKLISLWIVVEAFLGGIIHTFSLPISGLIVASGAVVCLCLIAFYCNSKKAILQATILVAICKAILSPQAPPTAYLAVFFQGLLAQILFINTKYFATKCTVLAVLSLVESGFQKIIVLMVLYGNNFFDALNKFISKILHTTGYHNYSLQVAIVYLLLHLFVGIWVGNYAAQLPNKIKLWKKNYFLHHTPISTNFWNKRTYKYKKITSISLAMLALITTLLINILHPEILKHAALKIIIRVVIVLCAWLILIEPLIKFVLNKWLATAKTQYAAEVAIALETLSTTKDVITQCWQQSLQQKSENKFLYFIKLLFTQIFE